MILKFFFFFKFVHENFELIIFINENFRRKKILICKDTLPIHNFHMVLWAATVRRIGLSNVWYRSNIFMSLGACLENGLSFGFSFKF